jgi:hypothetical protein
MQPAEPPESRANWSRYLVHCCPANLLLASRTYAFWYRCHSDWYCYVLSLGGINFPFSTWLSTTTIELILTSSNVSAADTSGEVGKIRLPGWRKNALTRIVFDRPSLNLFWSNIHIACPKRQCRQCWNKLIE